MGASNRSNDKRHVKWAKEIKERDDFTCQICLAEGVKLHSHHLNSYSWSVADRYLQVNGLTLCVNCHRTYHEIYSFSRCNTKSQFEEFLTILEILKKLAKNNK